MLMTALLPDNGDTLLIPYKISTEGPQGVHVNLLRENKFMSVCAFSPRSVSFQSLKSQKMCAVFIKVFLKDPFKADPLKYSHRRNLQGITKGRLHKNRECVYRNTCSRVPHIVISLLWQAETWLMFGRILRSLQVSPRSCRTYRAWSCYWEKKITVVTKLQEFFLPGFFSLALSAYLFVLEGLHELQHPAEGQRKGGTGPAVAVWHLRAAIVEVSLPVCVAAYFILPKDVRYEVSCMRAKAEKRGTLGRGACGKGSWRRIGLTFTAGWGEVFHQGCKKIVELREIRKELK